MEPKGEANCRTAFALSRTLDYARAVGNAELEAQVVRSCREKYLSDRENPLRYAPSAELMRRVLPADEFAEWQTVFLPGLSVEIPPADNAMQPAGVSDVTDPKIVHLARRSLARASTQNGNIAALSEGDRRRSQLEQSVAAPTQAGLGYVLSGRYEGVHWPATLAGCLLTETGMPP